MRKINNIVLHCTATQQGATVASVQRYWRENLGWKAPGYHYIICPDGTIVQLAHESVITNGVAGHNKDSIHISYIGGVGPDSKPTDNRTPAQRLAMERLVKVMRIRYPQARVLGHRDFPGVAKACPSFDVQDWLDENNI